MIKLCRFSFFLIQKTRCKVKSDVFASPFLLFYLKYNYDHISICTPLHIELKDMEFSKLSCGFNLSYIIFMTRTLRLKKTGQTQNLTVAGLHDLGASLKLSSFVSLAADMQCSISFGGKFIFPNFRISQNIWEIWENKLISLPKFM